MAVGRCIAAIGLALFALPLTVGAVRSTDEGGLSHVSTLEVHSYMNSSVDAAFVGCVVTAPRRSVTLEKIIGSGAEGEVYKAKDQSGKYAAVKLLRQGTELDNQEVKNLKALSLVRSRHINNLERDFEDVRECCGRPCLVTEFIAGKDAAKILWDNCIRKMSDVSEGKARRGALSYKLLRSILLQSLTGFRDTEKAQLCNTDQHLRNIMFEEATERIVFIDFGGAFEEEECPPKWPFREDSGGNSLLQSFRSLSYLLADDGDKTAYLELCDRLVKHNYETAEQALMSEAFASSPPDPSKPGAFFNRHPDHIITRQLQALLDTGSPYIGKVSGKGPWEDAVGTCEPVLQQAKAGSPPQIPSISQPMQSQTNPHHHASQKPLKPPSKVKVSRAECCRQGACITDKGRCLDVKSGYRVDAQMCKDNLKGNWCIS